MAWQAPGKKRKAGTTVASNASAKKRARSLERLLRRDNLPGDVRTTKLAELASLQQEGQQQAQQHRRKERERLNSKRYHKVKFFDRRKVERQIAALTRQLESTTVASEQAELQARLQHAQGDLLYVKHFPRQKKYLSLFPSSGAEDAPLVAKRRRRIRAGILKRAEAGLLDQEKADGSDEEGFEPNGALDDAFFEADGGANDAFFEGDAEPAGAADADAAAHPRSAARVDGRTAQPAKKKKRERAGSEPSSKARNRSARD